MSDDVVDLDFERYRNYVRDIARRRFFTPPDRVDDVVQDVALLFVQHAPRMRHPEYVKTWLFTTTRNMAVSHHRVEARHARRAERFAQDRRTRDAACHVEDDLARAHRIAAVREAVTAALPALPPSLVDVARAIVATPSNAHGARDVSVSVGTQRSRRHRLRIRLRDILGDDPRIRD